MDGKITYAERKFGHCEYIWSLSNYFLSTSGLDWEIHSPDFYGEGAKLTKWRMTLKRYYVREKEVYGNTLKLTRLEYAHNNGKVHTQCKLTGHFSFYEDKDEDDIPCVPEHRFFINFEHRFSANSTWEKEFGQEEFIEDDLKIKLIMVLRFEDEEEIVSPCTDLGIKELSENLSYLYETANHFDLNLKVGDKYIHAHTALLYRRIKKRSFNEKLLKYNIITLDFNDNFGAWYNVLKFLYTGNMEHVLTEPNLHIYQSAKLLGVEPVITYYEPHKIHMHSSTEVEEINFTWTIKQFLKRKEKYIYSPELIGYQGQKCRLKLYPISFGDMGKYNIGMFVQIELETEKHIRIEFTLKFGNSKFLITDFAKRVIGREIFGNRKMFEREELDSDFLPDGNMILYFNLKIPTGNQGTFYGRSISVCKPYSEQRNFQSLSDDLLALYFHPDFSDFSLNLPENNHIKAHMCILCCRHHSLVESYFASRKNLINKLNKETISYLLMFLYCSKIRGFIPTLCIVELSEIAEAFNISTLKCALIDNLRENIHSLDFDDIDKLAELRNFIPLKTILDSMNHSQIR